MDMFLECPQGPPTTHHPLKQRFQVPRALSPMSGKPTISPFGTPMSQASTALHTPCDFAGFAMLSDSCHSPFGFRRTWSTDTGSSAHKFLRTLSGDTWFPENPEVVPEDELEDLEAGRAEPEARPLCVGLPAMTSELAQLAQAAVRADDLLEDHTPPEKLAEFVVDRSNFDTLTVGLAYRRSKNPWDRELSIPGPSWGSTIRGRMVEDGWVKVGHLYLPTHIEEYPVLTRAPIAKAEDEKAHREESEVSTTDSDAVWPSLVRNSYLTNAYLAKLEALGERLRSSKSRYEALYGRRAGASASEAHWTTFAAALRQRLRGLEACRDGPALTPGGCVVDLEDGASIHFSHGRKLADSWEAKEEAKEEHRSRRAADWAHRACEAEARLAADEAAALDADGLLHGSLGSSECHGQAERLKLFRSKRLLRQSKRGTVGESFGSLCVGPNGRAFYSLKSDGPSQYHSVQMKMKRIWLEHKASQEQPRDVIPWAMDAEGVQHNYDTFC